MEENTRLDEYSENNDLNREIDEIIPIRPCRPLAESGHSLESDMIFGWRPKGLDLDGPVILSFGPDPRVEKPPLFYGFRPEDSFELHETISKLSSYTFKINPAVKHSYSILRKELPRSKRRPFVGMSPEYSEILFDSLFESGNLDKVVYIKDYEYDLYIRPDTNTRGHNQWFYFFVKNKSASKDVKFNILNFSKRDSLYTQGFSPYVLSSKLPNKGWHQCGSQVVYSPSKLNDNENRRRDLYSLSFTYRLKANEEVYFAHSIPYTYTSLLKFVENINSQFCSKDCLCKTLSGIETPLLTITDFKSPSPKENAVITARVHPGESHSSWVVEGLISFLLSNHSSARLLRSRLVFIIIPMLNPDGVIAGNSRCNLVGDDLNRQFSCPDERLHPTVHAVKQMMRSLEGKTLAYIDIHSHSKKKGSFFYAPHFPLHNDKYYTIRILPKLFSELCEMFRYHSSKYRNEWIKRNTARLVIWRQFKVAFSYTMESSCHGYINTERVTVPFQELHLRKLGTFLALAVSEYLEARDEQRRLLAQRKALRLVKNKKPGSKKIWKRTLEDVIQDIKQDHKETEEDFESDSGGSDSDYSREEEAAEKETLKLKIVNLLDQVLGMVKAPKLDVQRKTEDFNAKSILAKYFSKNHPTRRLSVQIDTERGSKVVHTFSGRRRKFLTTKFSNPLPKRQISRSILSRTNELISNRLR